MTSRIHSLDDDADVEVSVVDAGESVHLVNGSHFYPRGSMLAQILQTNTRLTALCPGLPS